MKLIPATEQHYSAIANLVTSPEELYLVFPSGQYPWDIQQLKTIAKKRHELTIGIVDNDVIAFSNFYDLVPQKMAYIGNVIVAQAYRGQGFGKTLIRHMINVCQQKYQAIPYISVFNFNTRALLMYADLGFVPFAVEQKLHLNNDRVALIHLKYRPEVSSMPLG